MNFASGVLAPQILSSNVQCFLTTKSLTMENNKDITSSYITTCVLNAFLSYTAVTLNCLTIYALTKVSSLPRPFKTLLLSLAVSDLGVGLMVQPSYIATLVMEKEQKTENNPAYNISDQFLRFTLNLFGFASFLGVTFLSLDRFLAVYLHLRYQELVTHKRVSAAVISMWAFSAVLSFMRLWISAQILYIIFVIIYIFFLLTMTALNYKIYIAVRHHANQMQASLQAITAQNSGTEMRYAAAASRRTFGIGALLIYLAFSICYLPNVFALIIFLFSSTGTSRDFLDLFSLTLLFLNSTLNPLIYCWKLRQIRQAFINVLRSLITRCC